RRRSHRPRRRSRRSIDMRTLVLALVIACGNRAPGAPGSGSQPPEEPDPIMKPLSEDEARFEASRLARREFARRTDIKDANGARVATPPFAPREFAVKHEADRWQLDIDPAAGPYAHVSFGAFGDHPHVDVGFAVE